MRSQEPRQCDERCEERYPRIEGISVVHDTDVRCTDRACRREGGGVSRLFSPFELVPSYDNPMAREESCRRGAPLSPLVWRG